jgi:hypothetical protein
MCKKLFDLETYEHYIYIKIVKKRKRKEYMRAIIPPKGFPDFIKDNISASLV